MKKITLFVLALAVFAACKNDPAPAYGTGAMPADGASATGQSEKVANGKANAAAQYKRLNDLITELDAMPADFRNKPEVEALRTGLEDISTKAKMMMQALEQPAADSKEPAADSKGELLSGTLPDAQDAINSMKRYGENIAAARAKFDELAAAYKAGN